MCLGAAVQSTVTGLQYAGRDPYRGAAHVTVDTPQTRRRPLSVEGQLEDWRGRFAELLHVLWLLDVGAEAVLAKQERSLPHIVSTARHPAAG